MATSGPNQAGTGTDGGNGGGGSASWTNVTKATVDNDDPSTCLVPGAGDSTNYLDLTNFGTFAGVANGDAISNIQVEVKCKSSGAVGESIGFWDIIRAGTPDGVEPGFGPDSNLSNAFVYRSVSGDPVNDFGFPALHGSDVNASNFGVRLVFATGSSGNRTISVDAVRITLTYTPSASPPVADFTGTPTSGTAPLSVAFTDASTNTPTSWLWEKNSGSGWVNFAGTPTAQNPTESFTAGTWSVRLTATNAGGSDTKTRTNYITANAPAAGGSVLRRRGLVPRPRRIGRH